MATYVLVHGAFHGGWCWSRVAPLLRAEGHVVYTPTLTGLGDRVHLATPDVNLSTHVTDVVNVIEFEQLQDVILVGHSYGGMVITGAIEQVSERLKAVVYLDAVVPDDGQAMADFTGGSREVGADWLRPVPPAPMGNFGIADNDDLQWVRSKLTPQPGGTLKQAVKISLPLEQRNLERIFIRATGPAGAPRSPGPSATSAQKLRENPAWRIEYLPTGHDVMVTMPRELTQVLLSLAG